MSPMTALAIRIIKDEHLAIASVLYGLRQKVRRIRDEDGAPDFALLSAMLDYIVAFPERLHHPKESLHLFAALAERSPAARPLVAELEAEHGRGDRMIRELRAALRHYRDAGATALPAFAAAVDVYADFHWQHMTKEEEVLLPEAERHLTPADWDRIGTAFRANDNPLLGVRPRDEAEVMYRRILLLAAAADAA
jgi:hemerythrin-like domain-containing protein